MKQAIFMVLLSTFSSWGFSQESEKSAIQQVITNFAKSADQNNVEAIEELLDANYRILMNQLFGSDELSVVDRATYLEKIRSKEWGGDDREVTFGEIIVNGNTATAHVTLKGKKATFISLFQLVKNQEGNWILVSDMPTIVG